MSNSAIVLARKLTLRRESHIKPSNKIWESRDEGMYNRGELAPYLRVMVNRINNTPKENPQDHYFEVDEASTVEYLKEGQKNKLKRLERRKVESGGVAGLAEAIGTAIKGATESKPEVKKVEKPKKETKTITPKPEDINVGEYDSLSLEELRALCDEREITYHHKAGTVKLIELLSE